MKTSLILTKKLASLALLAFLLANCGAKNIRIHNPGSANEAKKQSVVAFGLYKKFKSLFTSDYASPFTNYSITISEVISVDESKKTVVTAPFVPEKPIKVQEGDKKVYYGQESDLDNFYTLLSLDSNKKYCITKVTWVISCGQNCTQTIWRDPNPYQSFKSLPIQGEAGKVSFKGIFELQDIETTENDPEIYKFVDYIFLKKKWKKPEIVANSDVALNDFKKTYFLNKDDSDPSSIKKRFYTKLIERQGSGYWKDEADKELAKLK